MKVRVTLMTENNKHIHAKTKEELTAIARRGWELICDELTFLSEDEKATVESVEVIEE